MTRKNSSPAELGGGKKALALLIGKLCGIAAVPNISLAGPAGGVVTAGEGSISTPTATSTVIDQASNRLSVDWQSFDVAASESVRFNQPGSSSVALNRILDQKASEVFGRIDANGRVVLFNSHGIVFGPGSQVNVGSLLATSLNVISFDETTGQLRLSAAGTPGSIINSGTLTAAPGGSVSLVGGLVSNNGLIVADFGSVNLAAGRSATLDFYGGGLLRFDSDASLIENASGAAAGVSNSGSILANGGQVLLTTSAVQNVFDRAVNNDGLVSATRIDNSGGTIRLVGAGGTVVNSGVLDASGVGAGSTGGTVQVLGENVGLFGNARVDVSGDAGGGVALIGGDYQGANPDVLNARRTIVGPNAQISADARVAGDGGRVIVWSDDYTQVYGGISARGGATAGDGGFAEVSSHGALGFDGVVNLGAPAGQGGELLLDPETITIVAVGGTNTPDLEFDDTPADPLVTASSIVTALVNNAMGVTLQATDDIFVNAPIDATGAGGASGRTLRLHAGDNIDVNASIRTNNGAIELIANHPDGTPVSAVGTGDVTFLAAGTTVSAGTGNLTISSEGNLSLGTIAGNAISLTSETQSVSQQVGATLSGSSLTVSAATSINLDTNVTTLAQASAATGLNIDNTGDLNVVNAAGADVNISASGDLVLGMINAADTATLTSVNGAILDDGLATAVAAGDSIDLDAQTGIGQISSAQLLAGAAGTPLAVDTAGDLTATVTSAAGQINLEFVDQIPTIAAGDIDIGGAGNATGRILLQTADPFDVDAALPDDLFDLGAANTAQVGLRSGGLLTLPTDTTSIFVDAPGTFAVTGSNVVDGDGGAIAFTVGTLAFHSGAASTDKVLNTDVAQLTASVGNGNDLTVNEDDAITLTNVSAQNVDVTSSGAMTLGTVAAAGTVSLDAGATGAITDGAGVSVTANALSITGASLVDLNTNVNTLTAAGVGAGGLTINEASGPLTVTSATSAATVDISTDAGNLTVANASGLGVRLESAGTLTITGTVDANGATAALTSNGAMTLGVVTTAGTATLASGTGAITDGAGVSVTANLLNVTSAGSVDLNTNVNTLDATGVGAGGLTINEASGPLAVANASATGAVDISTAAGNLIVTDASGNGVTLDSAGTLTVAGTVNAGAGTAALTSNGAMTLGAVTTTGTATLAAGTGAITDGAGVSVTANQLNITAAGSVDLNTNVNTLNASGVGAGGLTINEASGPMSVANASTTGAVDISTAAGNLTVTNASGNGVTLDAAGSLTVNGLVNANAGIADLTAGTTLTSTAGLILADSAELTSNGAMALGAVTTGGATGVTLTANGGGAISDGAGVSVTANQLTVAAAGSVDLNTNVNTFTTTGSHVGAGGIVIVEGTGPLTVSNATSIGGAVNISTVAGDLTIGNAAGSGLNFNAGSAGASGDSTATGALTVTGVASSVGTAAVSLTADGNITLDTVNAASATVTLAARDGVIGDEAPLVPSVVANTLTITDADAANLDTNVATLNASGVTGSLNIRELNQLAIGNVAATGTIDVSTASGSMTVNNVTGNNVSLGAGGAGSDLTLTGTVNAGPGAAILTADRNLTIGTVTAAGAATLTATNGAILDDDAGTSSATGITAGSVALTAATAIGTVTNFETAAGLSVDVNTNGSLTANVTTIPGVPEGAQINLNLSGAPDIVADGILMGPIAGVGRTGRVLLQSAATLDLQSLDPNSIRIGASNNASVGYVSGGVLTLPAVFPTDAPPADLLVSGTDIVGPGGVRTIDLTGDTVVFNASAPIGNFELLTNVGTLHANVGTGVDLTVTENTGDIALGEISGRIVTVQANGAGGAILDDGNETTEVTAAQSIYLGSIGAIGSAAGNGAIDVSSPNVAAFAGTGDVAIRSVGTADVRVALTAGNAAAVAGNGNVTLTAAGDVLVAELIAQQDTVSVTAAGEIVNDAALPVVTASQLVIGGASAVDLGVNVDTLNASNVTGNLNVTELTGALNVADATAGGNVNVSTVGGALTVVNAEGDNVTLNASTDLTLGEVTADAATGTVTLLAGGNITDGAGPAASVVGNQLTITGASAADLDTNVNVLNASGLGGPLTIREQTGNLRVDNADSTTGAVSVTAVAGALTDVNALGADVSLSASGNISLDEVVATNTVTLASSSGAITDTGAVPAAVTAAQLTITGAASADLDTNVDTLAASGVGAGGLTVREQTGVLDVTTVTSTGTVNISTVDGRMTVANVTGNGVVLNAGGAASDLFVSGTVNAAGGNVQLQAGRNITDAAGAAPSVIAAQLTIAGADSVDLDTDVNTLDAAAVTGPLTVREQTGDLAIGNVSAGGDVSLSTVAGSLTGVDVTAANVSLSAGGAGSGIALGTVNTDPSTGTVSLAAEGLMTDAVGATPAVVANQLNISGAGSANLDTDVNILNASAAGGLTIREQTGSLAVANAAASGGAVNVSTVAGALTGVNATGTNVTLTAGGSGSGITLGTVNANPATGTVTLNAAGAIDDAAGAAASVAANQLTITGATSANLDTNVNTLSAAGISGALTVREQNALTVANATSGGALNVSTAAGTLTVTNATGTNVTLTAGGAGSGITLGTVNANPATGTVTLNAAGAIDDAAGAAASVVANQLAITGAGSANLDTNVNTLNASGVTGALSVREQTGALTVANVSAAGPVSISTVAGNLDVTEVASTGGLLTLAAGGAGNLTIAANTASGVGATLTSGGTMALGTLNAGSGAASLTSGGAMTLGTVNAASASLSSGGALTLGTVNANTTTGTVSLAANGAIVDAAGSTPSVVANQLTITGATSADLDTNVNILNASGVSGALTVREQSGPLAVNNAASTGGAVNLSTVAGALTGVNATGTNVTLTAGGGISLGTVNTGATGTVTLAASGAITDAPGAAASVNAATLTIGSAGSVDLDTNVNTLTAAGVTGALTVREQSGALTVSNASATGAINLSAVAGALTVTSATGNGATLNAGGAGSVLTLGTVNAGSGAATLSAVGAITDGTTGTSLTANSATINAGSIGSAANTLDVSLASLTATSTSGGVYVREANDITLTNVTAAPNQDVVVGAVGDITVARVTASGTGGVLLAAGSDILASGNDFHITAPDVELRAGGLDANGGRIGTTSTLLRLDVPVTLQGSTVPSVLLLQNQSAVDPTLAAEPNQAVTAGNVQVSSATFDRDDQTPQTYLTTTFSTRSQEGEGVLVQNAQMFPNNPGNSTTGLITHTTPYVQSSSANATAANAQGEGTLYIDWASFDPNVSLFGTTNPPICLPADQSDEDSGDSTATTSSGCASTTAQYDGSFRMPEVKLVITSRGVEWVTVPSGNVSVFPLIGQVR